MGNFDIDIQQTGKTAYDLRIHISKKFAGGYTLTWGKVGDDEQVAESWPSQGEYDAMVQQVGGAFAEMFAARNEMLGVYGLSTDGYRLVIDAIYY